MRKDETEARSKICPEAIAATVASGKKIMETPKCAGSDCQAFYESAGIVRCAKLLPIDLIGYMCIYGSHFNPHRPL